MPYYPYYPTSTDMVDSWVAGITFLVLLGVIMGLTGLAMWSSHRHNKHHHPGRQH